MSHRFIVCRLEIHVGHLDFFFFLLYWVSIAAHRLSLVVEREGYSFVAVHGLLTALSSLVAEHGL